MDVLSRYRENHNSSSSEDDSEDSDNECAVWKRATKKDRNEKPLEDNLMNDESIILQNNEKEKIEQSQQLLEQPKPGQKRKRNTIWSDVLQDQLISEDLEDCLLKNKPRDYGNRGKESYDYTRAYDNETKKNSESEISDCSLNNDSGADINSKSKKQKHFVPKNKFKKFVKLNSEEIDAARKINKVLNEKKYYLIQRIIKYAGIEKAMHLLELTKEVEENGGMMINNQTRRRTPGGVYIQMLRQDKEITKSVIDKIFEGEMTGLELKKYFDERKKKKKKKNSKHSSKEAFKRETEVGIEPMESGEIAAMDAEITVDVKDDVPNLDIDVRPVPVIHIESPENISDLEEGEIEE